MAAKTPKAPKFTNQAIKKLGEVIAANAKPVAGLRLQVTGRTQGQFQHVLSIVEKGNVAADDVVVSAAGIPVPIYLEGRNAAYLDEVKVHYEYKGADRSGIEVSNPNPLWLGETEKQLQAIIDTQLNPAIAAHGGYVDLIAIEGPTAYNLMGGGCQGCGMADVTLKQGIQASIVGVGPGIERIVDTTDHDAGTNPYYQPAKK
jgi:Fe/S biogenesis protein NfuA